MSITSASSPASSHPRRDPQPWQPAFTAKEAKRLSVAKALYMRLVLWARMVVEHHQRLGTPRNRWEGNANHNDQFTSRYIEDGEQQLGERLSRDIDPTLDEAHGLLEDAKGGLDAAAQHPRPVTTPESGATYSGDQAVK
ncbi:MAG: hypothetical protein ACRDTD_27315, partial [Pseudonocardiaceae bacterium]